MAAMPTVEIPAGRPLTIADLAAMPDDGHRYELLDGVLIVTRRRAGRIRKPKANSLCGYANNAHRASGCSVRHSRFGAPTTRPSYGRTSW